MLGDDGAQSAVRVSHCVFCTVARADTCFGRAANTLQACTGRGQRTSSGGCHILVVTAVTHSPIARSSSHQLIFDAPWRVKPHFGELTTISGAQ
eukprot:IDg3843t1